MPYSGLRASGWGVLFYQEGFSLFGFLIQAFFGGLAIGLAFKVHWTNVIAAGTLTALGFLAGTMLLLPFVLFIGDRFSGEPPLLLFLGALRGGLMGMAGGAAMAVGLGKKGLVKTLAIAGTLGFGLAMLIATPFHYRLNPQHWVGNILAGIVGGGVLGAGVGNVQRSADAEI